MRSLLIVLVSCGIALGQASDTAKPADAPAAAQSTQAAPANAAPPAEKPAAAERGVPKDPNALVIPAGTKIPLTLVSRPV